MCVLYSSQLNGLTHLNAHIFSTHFLSSDDSSTTADRQTTNNINDKVYEALLLFNRLSPIPAWLVGDMTVGRAVDVVRMEYPINECN